MKLIKWFAVFFVFLAVLGFVVAQSELPPGSDKESPPGGGAVVEEEVECQPSGVESVSRSAGERDLATGVLDSLSQKGFHTRMCICQIWINGQPSHPFGIPLPQKNDGGNCPNVPNMKCIYREVDGGNGPDDTKNIGACQAAKLLAVTEALTAPCAPKPPCKKIVVVNSGGLKEQKCTATALYQCINDASVEDGTIKWPSKQCTPGKPGFPIPKPPTN